MVSKGHRKKPAGPIATLFQTGRAVLRTVENCEQLDPAMDVLIDLHQKRRQMLGEPGCFASPRFTAFHREVAQRLLAGRPIATPNAGTRRTDGGRGYQLASQGVTYVYQARHRSAATG